MAMDHGCKAIVIADHGNSGFSPTNEPFINTAHTMNPVPFIFVSTDKHRCM
ncbi:MAG: hypothetical protein IPL27_27745 [Lewinellaceae bacterium]|nr:hypothetical protein [Lewinellaceae bacterium]